MSKGTYALLSSGKNDRAASFHEVDGSWVEVFPGMDTFIWSDEDQDIEELEAPYDVFHVVDGRSGACIGRGLDREMAIESAKTNTRARGRGGMLDSITKTIARYGLSPSYITEGGRGA